MSHNVFNVHLTFHASNPNARRLFPALAISGNSKGVSAANFDKSAKRAQAFFQSQSIVLKAIAVCSKSQAIFIPSHHNHASAVHAYAQNLSIDFPAEVRVLPKVFVDFPIPSKEPLTSLRAFVAVSVHLTTVCRISSV